jgi:hypothetical protein
MLHRLRNAGLSPGLRMSGLRMSGLRILLFALLLASPVSVIAADPPATAFVRTSGTEFTVDGKTFFVTGVSADAWFQPQRGRAKNGAAQMDDSFQGDRIRRSPALPTKGVAG